MMRLDHFITGLIAFVCILPTQDLTGQTSKGWPGQTIKPAVPYEAKPEEQVLRFRYVDVPEFIPSQNVTLNLFEDVQLTADQAFIDRHPAGSIVWAGRIRNQKFGYAMIARSGDTYWAKAETDDGSVYIITRIAEQGDYVIKHITVDHLQEEGCSDPDLAIKPERGEDGPGSQRVVTDICDPASSCPADTMAIMVVYNGSASSDLGGQASAEAAIAAAVSEMNMISSNSSVIHHTLLTHAEMVSYTQSGNFSTDLNRLRDPDDGHLDNVHFLRDKYYADLVSLIVGGGGCGIGYRNTSNTAFNPSLGFSVCDDGCLTGNKTLAHETGHNLSLHHDRYVVENESNNACDFGWGYVNQEAFGGNPSQRWRTILAYNNQCADSNFNCTRIAHWSNPDIDYQGDPTGIPIGDTAEAHNAFILDRAMCWAAGFRVEPDCDNCTIYIGCNSYDPGTGNGASTIITFPEPPAFTNPFGDSVEVCVSTIGDHSSSSEDFNVKDENGVILGQTATGEPDCTYYPARVCFSVSAATYNAWLVDGITTIELDPTTNQINPALCEFNQGCAELLVPETPGCLSGGIYTGIGTGGQILPEGTYSFLSDVTLANFFIPSGANVTLICNGTVTTQDNFTIMPGATLDILDDTCP